MNAMPDIFSLIQQIYTLNTSQETENVYSCDTEELTDL